MSRILRWHEGMLNIIKSKLIPSDIAASIYLVFVQTSTNNNVLMPKAGNIFDILQRLWAICFGEGHGSFDWKPKDEFRYQEHKSVHRAFPVEDFEGKGEIKHEKPENDGGPGHAGLDVLGEYMLKDGKITIYVDLCGGATSRYSNGTWTLENLIKVVLIHELAHLVTHRGFELKGNESNHVWEYTAQCATYAYLKTHGDSGPFRLLKNYRLTSRSFTVLGKH